MTRHAFARWLRRLDLTPREAAERIGVNKSAVYHWLSGRRRMSWLAVQRCEQVEKEMKERMER